jgi:hypothetical protein
MSPRRTKATVAATSALTILLCAAGPALVAAIAGGAIGGWLGC